MARTIFDRLRTFEADGKPLHNLIAEACDVGDEIVHALEMSARTIEIFNETLREYGAGQPASSIAVAAIARAAIDRAYSDNGDTPDNGKAAA